ncbi:MAG: 2-oxoacid:acceptor oxidoreductase subunit alpha [Rhodothermales bacterium]|nr:2-oxoacid:acceptor oxidoreductase subunit alpha [Rhodothermales bacterium]
MIPLETLPPGASRKPTRRLDEVTVLFAGDSGDGMQLTGTQFTLAAGLARNDLATLPDFPAEIRAPAGTTYGVSGYQLHFGTTEIYTPGDDVDLLVAMNPAALKVNLHRVREGGGLLLNLNAFDDRGLELAGYESNPLDDGSLAAYEVFPVELTKLTREALAETELSTKQIDQSKNMFALGLALWLYNRPTEGVTSWLEAKFKDRPEILEANHTALKKGYHYGETAELFAARYEVGPAESLPPGLYRGIRGNEALALGLVTAAQRSGLEILYGSYPITPASDLLHALSKYKNYGVLTVQAEDEIAAVGAALGSSFAGNLGITATSGPGLALKAEFVGLAVMTELPLVVIDVQRAGPSTGMPTKTEQSDLLFALYGRNGEAPLPVIAASTPGDCYEVAYEACRVAVTYMTPVILLSDGYLGNGAEPWPIPDPERLSDFPVRFAGEPNADGSFLPYVRDAVTRARPWAKPGTAGLEHRIGGLEKDHETGGVSYDPQNHEQMTKLRAEKVERVQQEIPRLRVLGAEEGDLLVVGWGSTRGAIEAAVRAANKRGQRVGHLHLRWLNPLPADLEAVLDRYDRWLVPELNNGQLVHVLRGRYLRPFEPLTKIQGLPFKASEVEDALRALLTPAEA